MGVNHVIASPLSPGKLQKTIAPMGTLCIQSHPRRRSLPAEQRAVQHLHEKRPFIHIYATLSARMRTRGGFRGEPGLLLLLSAVVI